MGAADHPTRLRKARLRVLRWTSSGVLAVLVFAIAFALAATWRLSGPGVVVPSWAFARIEDRLDAALAGTGLSAAAGGVALRLDATSGADAALRVVLRDAALAFEGATVLRVDRAEAGLAVGALLRGAARLTALQVSGVGVALSRDRSGVWSIRMGGGGGPPPTLADLDALLERPALAGLERASLEAATISIRDERTGFAQTVGDGTAALERVVGGVALTLAAEVPLGADTSAALRGEARRDGDGLRARLDLTTVSLPSLASRVPAVPALGLVSGTAAARIEGGLDAGGEARPVTVVLTVADPTLRARPRLRADRIALEASWYPGSDRVHLPVITMEGAEAELQARGTLLLEDGLIGPVTAQVAVETLEVTAEGAMPGPLRFDGGVIEARLTEAPLAVTLGQAALSGPSGTVRASGEATFGPAGPTAALDVTVPEMRVADVAALWPVDLARGPRRWFTENLLAGTVRDASASLRVAPAGAPVFGASATFEDGSVRFMRHMPPAKGARGALGLRDGRFAVRVDEARVPSRGRDGVTGAPVRITDLTVEMRDLAARPIRGRVSLSAEGAVGDVLAALDHRPLRLLERMRKDRDFATGTMRAEVEVALPLRRGNAPADVDWAVEAALLDVATEELVAGRRIAADALTLRADPEAVSVAGRMLFDGIPFAGAWRQPLPPPSTVPIVPDAPPQPPRRRPPAVIEGTATVTPEALAAFGIPAATVRASGAAPAALRVDLPPGEAPSLTLTSDAEGLALGLPAVGWAKPAGRRADVRVEARLGDAPEVTRLSLEAPGLAASGRVALRSGGGLERLRFDRVDLGWFAGPVTVTGRGLGRAPSVAVTGGRADLRRALAALGGGGGGARGEGAPVSVALDRLALTDRIALTGLRADLRGAQGTFTGRVNGGASVEGRFAPRGGGVAVTARTQDAGGVLRDAGAYANARGGAMEVTLQPAGGGAFDGSLRGSDLTLARAPTLARLLQRIASGRDTTRLRFGSFGADFRLDGGRVALRRAGAEGPGLAITARGTLDLGGGALNLTGVVSPFRGAQGPGVSYSLRGPVASPTIGVEGLSLSGPRWTGGRFRSDG